MSSINGPPRKVVSAKPTEQLKRKVRSKKKSSKFLDDEAEYDSDFIDDNSIDESDSNAINMVVKDAAKAMRNRRSFTDEVSLCAICKQLRLALFRLLGLS